MSEMFTFLTFFYTLINYNDDWIELEVEQKRNGEHWAPALNIGQTKNSPKYV